MKKILLSIFGIFLGLSAFCSAEDVFLSHYNSKGARTFSDFGFNITNISDSSYCIDGFYMNLSSYEFPYWSIFSDYFTGFSYSYYSSYCVYDFYGFDCYKLSFDPVCLSPGDSFSLYIPSLTPVGVEYNVFGTFMEYSRNYDYGGVFTGFFVGSGKYNSNDYNGTFIAGINYLKPASFTVNYGSQSKEYSVDQDIDIFINSPVVKNGSTFTFDGSTGINLVYNGQYNWYNKNKLYIDGQFRFRQGVFTPICL